MLTLLVAPLLAQAALSPVFAPPLDRAIDYRVAEDRDDGATRQRFVIDRRVTFRRAGDGYVAEVETLAVDGRAGGAGRLFEAGLKAMIDLPMRVDLDRQGRVTGVRDHAALWTAQIAAIARGLTGPAGDAARAATVARMVTPLRAMPPAEQVRRLAEALTPLIGGPDVAPHPARAIRLPARALDGTEGQLDGSETTRVGPDGRLCLDRTAAGTVGGQARRLATRRCIDPATRLVVELVETSETPVDGRPLTIRRTTAITSPVS